MSTLLHIDSSPMFDNSVTRELTADFASQWAAKHPTGKVIVRDLYATPIAPVDEHWVAAVRTPADARTPEQAQVLKASDAFIGELETADEYVFGVPLHNFSIPSVLKLWIDQITRAQRTFSYGDGTPKGLLLNKKATFIVATGGPQVDAYNFAGPYLLALFAFIGVTDAKLVTVNGTMALNFGADRQEFLVDPRQAVNALFPG